LADEFFTFFARNYARIRGVFSPLLGQWGRKQIFSCHDLEAVTVTFEKAIKTTKVNSL